MESLRAERKAIVRSWYIVSSSVFSLAATQHQKQKQMKFPGAVIQIQSSLWLAEGPKRSRWIRNVRYGTIGRLEVRDVAEIAHEKYTLCHAYIWGGIMLDT